MAEGQFTLHRRLWRSYRHLPRLVQIWIVAVVVAALIEIPVRLSGPGEEQGVRDAVTAAVREATGPDPGSSCAALSPAGLSEVLSQLGGQAPAPGANELAACQQLVVRLRAQASPQQVEDIAKGGVRLVQFHADGSATITYLAADRKLGVQLVMSQHGDRWLIDSVVGGEVAAAAAGAAGANTP